MVYRCPACPQTFKKKGFLNSHLRQKKKCAWVLQQRQNSMKTERRDFTNGSDGEDDPPLDDNVDNSQPDSPLHGSLPADFPLFPLPSSTSNPTGDQSPEPFPSFHDHSKRARVEEVLDEEAVREVYPQAGKIYGWEETVWQRFKTQFNSSNPYRPFANRMEWELARWAKETKAGDNSLTKLLAIPGVRYFSLLPSLLLIAGLYLRLWRSSV